MTILKPHPTLTFLIRVGLQNRFSPPNFLNPEPFIMSSKRSQHRARSNPPPPPSAVSSTTISAVSSTTISATAIVGETTKPTIVDKKFRSSTTKTPGENGTKPPPELNEMPKIVISATTVETTEQTNVPPKPRPATTKNSSRSRLLQKITKTTQKNRKKTSRPPTIVPKPVTSKPLSHDGEIEAALRHLNAADPFLSALISTYPPPKFDMSPPPFEALARSICFQQLATGAAATIYNRFLGLCGGESALAPTAVLSITADQLRQVGLSYRKASYLHDLASKYLNGTLTDSLIVEMDDESLLTLLTMVNGIGPWSVHMFMIFSLHRPDVLPIGDFSVRKGVQLLYGLEEMPKEDEMDQLCEKWRPYRSVGSWYMWRIVESKAKEAKAAKAAEKKAAKEKAAEEKAAAEPKTAKRSRKAAPRAKKAGSRSKKEAPPSSESEAPSSESEAPSSESEPPAKKAAPRARKAAPRSRKAAPQSSESESEPLSSESEPPAKKAAPRSRKAAPRSRKATLPSSESESDG